MAKLVYYEDVEGNENVIIASKSNYFDFENIRDDVRVKAEVDLPDDIDVSDFPVNVPLQEV